MATVEARPVDESQALGSEPTVLFKKRSAKSKQTVRKRVATPLETTDSESQYSSEDDSGTRVKKRKKSGLVTAGSADNAKRTKIDGATKYTADTSAAIASVNDATKHSNWFEEDDSNLSAKNLLGSTRKQASATSTSTSTTDRTYKGAANYQSYIQKNPDAPDRKFGPVKAAATNVRTITVTDFAPDVCKDYKQTGFCGFGDSCKFLHAREDYKQGWQLDRDWEIGKDGKKISGNQSSSFAKKGNKRNVEEDEEAMLEKIPFACIICKKSYKDPIVTNCNHYFCESCAIQRYRKNPTCAACGAGTGGVFNNARNLRKLLEKKKQREESHKENDLGADGDARKTSVSK